MKKALLFLLTSAAVWGQGTVPSTLQVSRVYGITSTPSTCTAISSQCFDNRSTLRSANYFGFYVTGSGSWSVTMEYSDSSASGPWTSFGAAAVVTNASSPPIGYGTGYHDYIRFNITGTVNVTLSATKDFFLSTSVGAVSFPITASQGGTGINLNSTGSATQVLRKKPNVTTPAYEFADLFYAFAGDYSFSYTVGGGSLTGDLSAAGAKTVTMTPCPLGVAGADSGHYYYISGGTGTAEAVLGTGGTCTSGAATGTLSFTTANTHTGSWVLASATAGIQEADNALGIYGTVRVGKGIFDVYAPFLVTTHIEVVGSGSESTILRNRGTTTGVARFVLPNLDTATKSARLANLSIIAIASGDTLYSTALNETTGTAVYLEGANHGMFVDGLVIKGHKIGIDIYDCINVRVSKSTIFYSKDYGIKISASTDGATAGVYISDTAISNFGYSTSPLASGAGIFWKRGGGIFVRNVDITSMPHGVLIQPGSGESAQYGFFTDVLADSCISHGWLIDAATGVIKTIHLTQSWASYTGNPTSSSFDNAGVGMTIQGANLDGLFVNGVRVRENGGSGVVISSGSNIYFSNCEIAQNSQFADDTHQGVAVAANASDWGFTNCRIGNFASAASNTQANGITVAAGTSNNYHVINNDLRGNTTNGLNDAGTGVNKIIFNNRGVDDQTPPTIASGTSIALPGTGHSKFYISGNTAIATITGGRQGQIYRFIFTHASPAGVTTGGNIPRAKSAAQYEMLIGEYDGTSWHIN